MTETQKMILDEIVSGNITSFFQFQMKMDICGCDLTEEMISFLVDLREKNVYFFIRNSFSQDTSFDEILIKDSDNFCSIINNHDKWAKDYSGKVNIWFILDRIFKRRPGLLINYYLKNEKNFIERKFRDGHDMYEYFLISKCEEFKEKLGKYYDIIIEKSKYYQKMKTFTK